MSTVELPHVLVVGEDRDLTMSICRSLEVGPFRCSGAMGSREALAVARQADVDVALLDVSGWRPEDGLQLAQRLRDERRDLGVVLMAANRSLEDLVGALRVGIVDFLAKPVSSDELTDAVTRAVEWRETVQQSRGSLARYEEEIADGGVRIGRLLTDADVTSTGALDRCLAQVYGARIEALEHARRVAAASAVLAAALDIADPLLGHVVRAGLLHDIGKLAIPRSILANAWPLSSGEHALVRSHARVAAEAVSRVPFLAPAAEIVGAVRERYDGGGYPQHLRGTAIPMGARVIAVAEAFDTLSRGPRSATEATRSANAHLVRHAGTWFDPHVVHGWLRCQDAAVREVSAS
jgi:response regulator RpfG family c-di-GMP phosphodiesterase